MRKRFALVLALALLLAGSVEIIPADDKAEPADLILHHAKLLTVDAKFTVAEAIAIKGDRILVIGEDADVLRHAGPKTKVIDAQGHTIMPGLYDSHTHPVGAATSELAEPLPDLPDLAAVFAHIRKKAAATPEGEWIVLRYVFPTRLKEARFPTRAELDQAAPKHPVLYHAGPAGIVNSKALEVSKVTRDTPSPPNGSVVKDPKTGEPTGMLRNAYGVLRGVPGEKQSNASRTEAVKWLFRLYNARGLTSVADRNASRSNLDLYLAMEKAGELTVRINVARSVSAAETREQVARNLDALPGKDGLGGPTGKGGIWVRIGPIKFFLDGGMLNGSAYMRQPWPKGDTYQIVEDDYRGLLFTPPEQAKMLVEEAVKRGWSVTAHCAGEGAMDVLLDAYEFADRMQPIKERRLCITHANFPSQYNLERCQRLGVLADVQPAWLYKDGDTLARVLGPERIRWFQPYKSWLKYTTIGGGSDHMIRLDPLRSVNPWDPWLAMEVAITRKLESGQVLVPEERLTREEALRLYTINNAYLNHEEKEKGSLEPGKLADLIVIDQDYLTCPEDSIAQTRVLTTIVGGKVVYERKRLQGRRDGVADLGRRRRAPLVHRQGLARAEHLCHRAVNPPPRLDEPRVLVATAEPVEEHRRRQDRRHRVGDAAAGDVGGGAVGWLENGMAVADVARRSHSHAADEPGGQVGEDVAEHVLRHEHVELPRPLHQVERLGVDVGVLMGDAGIALGHLVEHLAKESVTLEDVRLVHAGDLAAGQAEGEVADALDAGTGHDQRVGRQAIAQDDAAGLRGEQPFGLLAQDHQVDGAGLDMRQRAARPGIELARPHAGVQVEQHPQRHLRRQLGPIGLADVGMPHGPEQHRIRPPARVQRLGREIAPRLAIAKGATRILAQLQPEQAAALDRAQHLDRLGRHLDADAVARQDRDVEFLHLASLTPDP